MFYEPKDGHGLPHNPFNALITPRPIGWISTRGPDGSDNLAPYSFFNGVAYTPPQVVFASTGAKPDRADTKDSLANIRETGVFCANVVGFEMQDAMNVSSGVYDREEDEFALAGLEKAPCQTIECARIADVPAALECRMRQIVELAGPSNYLVVAEVTGVYINDAVMRDGKVDPLRYKPLARMGYRDYTHVAEVFTLARPDE